MDAEIIKRVDVKFEEGRNDRIIFRTFEGKEETSRHVVDLQKILEDGDDYRALVFAQILIAQSNAEQMSKLAHATSQLAAVLQKTVDARPAFDAEKVVGKLTDQMTTLMSQLGLGQPPGQKAQ